MNAMELLVALITRGRQRSVSTAGGLGFILLAALATLAAGCKPADEPARLAAEPQGTRTRAEADAGTSPGQMGTIRLVAPAGVEDSGAPEVGADSAGGAADPAVGDAPVSAAPALPDDVLARATALGVTGELRAQIAVEPTAEQKTAAADANRRGLKHHRKLDLGAAAQAYEAGLGGWAGHVFSRYNLACARALQGDSKEALKHLAVLTVTLTEVSRTRLRAARTDPDFQTMQADVAFRAMTRFAPVEVSWSPSVSDDASAVTLVDALRRADIPAHEGREWRKDLPVTTLYVAINDTVAQGMADEIEAASSLPLKRVDSRFLSVARPIVLVLGTGDAAASRAVGAATTVDELLDVPMIADHGGIQEQLQLKRTGFFSWTVGHPDGKRLTRTGRYTLVKDSVLLDFRPTTETPGDPPTVIVEQGRRETYVLRVEEGELMVGSVRFVRAL